MHFKAILTNLCTQVYVIKFYAPIKDHGYISFGIHVTEGKGVVFLPLSGRRPDID